MKDDGDGDGDVHSSPFFQSGGWRLWSMEAEHALISSLVGLLSTCITLSLLSHTLDKNLI
jgi:hypothetical protein